MLVMCISMLIFGLFFVLGENINHIMGTVEDAQAIQVFIEEGTTNDETSWEISFNTGTSSDDIKVVGEYDANDFNSDGDISGYDAGDVELYLYKRDGVYYPIAMIDGVPHSYGLEDENGTVIDITEDKLYRFFEFTKAHLGIDVDKSDFAVLNGAGGGAPGSDTNLLLEIFGDKYNIAFNG